MPLNETAADIELPLERPLYQPPVKPVFASFLQEADEIEVDTTALYAQTVVDKAQLRRNIRLELQSKSQVSLQDVVARHPLQHGLAELVAYLQLASEWPQTAVDEATTDTIPWLSEADLLRQATLPRIIFLKE